MILFFFFCKDRQGGVLSTIFPACLPGGGRCGGGRGGRKQQPVLGGTVVLGKMQLFWVGVYYLPNDSNAEARCDIITTSRKQQTQHRR